MEEAFLHYVWKFRRYHPAGLRTSDGQVLEILDQGKHNHDAGPDFLNGIVRIGETRWHGHIELHLHSREWESHAHHKDPAYNNVILHVVYRNSRACYTQDGRLLPVLELEGRVDEKLYPAYLATFDRRNAIPCSQSIHQLNPALLPVFLEKLLLARLQGKSDRVLQFAEECKMDWEQVCYRLVLRYLGGYVNREAFAILSNKVPHRLLVKYQHRLLLMEALLFGQAGLFKRFPGVPYLQNLHGEYLHMQKKHRLEPMSGIEWKFSRLRPEGNPMLRIAQAAAVYSRFPRLFASLQSALSARAMLQLLHVPASGYWDSHYIPGKKSRHRVKTPGRNIRASVALNAFIPLLFSYGSVLKKQNLKDRCLSLLGEFPAENNRITRSWVSCGIHPRNSAQSQALIELKTQYCDNYKCLHCAIGTKLLLNEE